MTSVNISVRDVAKHLAESIANDKLSMKIEMTDGALYIDGDFVPYLEERDKYGKP